MKQSDQTYIYGIHPIEEAFARAPKTVRHVYFVGKKDNEAILTKCRELNIPFDRCDEDHLPRGVDRDPNHQGILARVSPNKLLVDYKHFIKDLEITENSALVLLDELTDPHNVGAIIRNAVAFGLAGVLIPEYRQAQVTGTVVKVSAGMAFSIPLVSVGNVNTALRDLKDKGFWIYGLTGDGDTSLTKEQFTKPSVFVIGNEGRGLREKTEELCDFRLRIPIDSKCDSLNAAASSAVTFYAWQGNHAAPSSED